MTSHTTFQVSLFLPYTIDFDDLTNGPTPERHESPSPPLRSAKAATFDGALNILSGSTPPETPGVSADVREFFAQTTPPTPDIHLTKPYNPRAPARTDTHISDWGHPGVFRQPRSRAGPPPPSTILEYAMARERQATRAISEIRSRSRGLSAIRNGPSKNRSREQSCSAFSSDRAFEETNWSVQPAVQGNGGLTNAVRAASERPGAGHQTWVGTLGFPTDALKADKKNDIEATLEGEYDALTVFVNDSDFDGHYSHYCKTILWPVFHYQIPDHPKSKAYEDHSWKYYVKINQAFADKVNSSFKRGDIVWIHDYHLLLVPQMIRAKHPDAQIGFFLHTAFPSSEVFRCLAVRKQLLEGMLGANLIAFQCQEYAHHFLQTCSRILVVEATGEGVQLDDHFVNVTNCPLGIVPEQLFAAREEQPVTDWIQVMSERYAGKHLIVARDKLDNIRGVKQKLLAYEMFLKEHPEWHGKVVLIQVATSTSGDDHKDLHNTISDIVNRISSRYSTLAHQPLVFLKQDISFSQYLALLTVADVLMVTSLRDGMNLSCHEYITCQDGKASHKKHGPLILSEFTGAASIFRGAELSVNPWDYRQCSSAILKALEMSPEEKSRRYSKLLNIVLRKTGTQWVDSLSKRLREAQEGHRSRDAMSVPRLSLNSLAAHHMESRDRLFILDYEGTLAAWGSVTDNVVSSPQRVFNVMNDLLVTPPGRRNTVYIMSGQAPEELELLFSQVPSVGLIAENGCFIRPVGAEQEWITLPDMDKAEEWKQSVKGTLSYYNERIEGSWIETKQCSIIFHYERVSAVDAEAAARQAGDCVNHINESCRSQRVHAIPVDKAVIIEPIDWSKLTATQWVLDNHNAALSAKLGRAVDGPDFLMVAGDDREDEAVFKWANSLDARNSTHPSEGNANSGSHVNGHQSHSSNGSNSTSDRNDTSNGHSEIEKTTVLSPPSLDRTDSTTPHTPCTPAPAKPPHKINHVVTVHVGKRGATEAGATLTQGTHGLLTALQKLARTNETV